MVVSRATKLAQKEGLDKIHTVVERVQLRIDELAGVQALQCLQRNGVENWDHWAARSHRAIVAIWCVSEFECNRCERLLRNY